jgi:PAS domain S-box-containing protein
MAEATLDALALVTPQGVIKHWTWGAENLYGISAEEAVGKSFHELLIPVADRAEMDAAMVEATGTGSAILETRRRRPDGSTIEVQSLIRAVHQEEGEPLLALCDKDISDQKRMERELSERMWAAEEAQLFLSGILEASGDYSIVATDPRGHIVQWNQGAHNAFGYPASEANGRSFESLLFAHDGEGGEQLKAAMETVKASGRHEVELEAVTFDTRRGPYGAAAGLVVTIRDLTEQKRLDAEKAKQAEQTARLRRQEDAERVRTSVLNTASHQLATPLTPLSVNLHLLASGKLGPLTPKQEEALNHSLKSTQRLSRIIDQIIEIGKIQADMPPEALADLSDAKLPEAIRKTWEGTADRQGRKLVVELDPPRGVQGDPPSLLRALDALIDNAMRVTPRGQGVRVESRLDGKHWRILVTDEGPGLPEEDREGLFQPFHQAQADALRTDSGTGIGLVVAKTLAERQGAKIDALPFKKDRGATFRISFPAPNGARPATTGAKDTRKSDGAPS